MVAFTTLRGHHAQSVQAAGSRTVTPVLVADSTIEALAGGDVTLRSAHAHGERVLDALDRQESSKSGAR
jgi:hypothetical protein